MARRSSVLVLAALLVCGFALEANAQTEASGGGGLTSPFASSTTVTLGSGTGTGTPIITPLSSGVSSAVVTSSGVCNGADATDDTLWSYTLPANSFSKKGDSLLLDADAFTSAAAGTNTWKTFAGANSVSSTATASQTATIFSRSGVYWLTASTALLYIAPPGGTVVTGSVAIDWTVSNLIKFTAANSSSNANANCTHVANPRITQ